MKKQIIFTALAAMSLCLTACGSNQATLTTNTAATAAVTEATAAATTAAATATTAAVTSAVSQTTESAAATVLSSTAAAQTVSAAAKTTVSETTAKTASAAKTTTAAAASDKPNAYGFYPFTEKPREGTAPIRVTDLEGNWESGNTYITFFYCDMYAGKFNMYNADNTLTVGDVKLEYSQNSGNMIQNWYNLYDDEGKFVIGFEANGDIPVNELYNNQTKAASFKQYIGTMDYIKTRQGMKPEDYVGTWSVGRYYVAVDLNDNVYNISVKLATSASESTEWSYLGHYDPMQAIIVCNGTGKRTHTVCSEDGNVTSKLEKEGATAIFVMREGVLKWVDEDGHEADDCEFLPISQDE